jgi:acyl dehydratase
MYFEDYVPGNVSRLRTDTFSEASIMEFARQYDPQEFHINPGAAARSLRRGDRQRLAHLRVGGPRPGHGVSLPWASLPSPGIDEVRFHTPVRAGDTLTWWATVLVARASRSTPSRGIVRTLVEAVNQDGSLAASMTAINLMRRRPVAGT